MANVFLKAEKIVSQGLGLLQRELILPRLVGRYTEADFKGVKDDTLTIRIPSLLQGREYAWRNNRSSPITIDDLEEYSTSVVLNKHVYSAVQITDEQNTLDIVSWGEQVARPQVRAVAEQAESYIADAMAAANYRHQVTYTPGDGSANDTSFFQTLVQARKHLNQENVPAGGRVVVLGASVEAEALQSPHLIKTNEAGSDSALREATIGRLAGFTVIGNVNSVPDDFAVAFHPSAFAFANVAPVVPPSVPSGSRETFESIALRWIRQYNSSYLREESVYSLFAGAASIEDGRDLDGDTTGDFGSLTDENVRAVLIEYAGS